MKKLLYPFVVTLMLLITVNAYSANVAGRGFPANNITIDTVTLRYINTDDTYVKSLKPLDMQGNALINFDTSGLNAAKLDGLGSTEFLRSNVEDTQTTTLNIVGIFRADTIASYSGDAVALNDTLTMEGNDIVNQKEPGYDTGVLQSGDTIVNSTFDLEANGHFDLYLDGVIQYPGEYSVVDSTTVELNEAVSTETDYYIREIQ